MQQIKATEIEEARNPREDNRNMIPLNTILQR